MTQQRIIVKMAPQRLKINVQPTLIQTKLKPIDSLAVALAPQGPPGPQGIQGVPGPQGIPGSAGGTNYLYKNSDYWASFSDVNIGVDCSDGPVTIYLPIATLQNLGGSLTVKKLDSTIYQVTVMSQEGQLIDSLATTFTISYPNEAYEYKSTGTAYSVY